MAGITRKNCLLIAGVMLMLLPLALAAAMLLDLMETDTPQRLVGTRQFQTDITLHTQSNIPPSAPDLFYENVLDGGTRAVNCYPSLPSTTTYIFWNPDQQNPADSLQPYVHAYNRDFFSEGETVQITVYRPDGTIYLRRTMTAPVDPLQPECGQEAAAVGISWAFLPDDPVGEWQVEFSGAREREITYLIQLQPHQETWISRYCHDSEYALLLDGFEPEEAVDLLLASISPEFSDLVGEVEMLPHERWSVQVDQRGQLRVNFADDVPFGERHYLLIERANGEIVGQRQPLAVEASLNRFQPCNADFFAPPVTTPPPQITESTAVTPTELAAECPNAPPSRFTPGETVVVDFTDIGALKIRTLPDYVNGVPLEQAYDGDELLLLEGPVCDPAGDRWAWRLRRLRTGTEGWAAEGITDDNWMCPLSNPECGS